MASGYESKVRRLVIVLGDQLNADASAFDGFDREGDAVLMMEVADEATYIPQHKTRLALFFSAMRHFQQALSDQGHQVHYAKLEDRHNRGSFAEELKRWVHKTRPEKLVLSKPGDHRVEQTLRKTAKSLDCKLDIRADRHFLCDPKDFQDYAKGRKSLVLDGFYRQLRRRHDILMNGDDPRGGQ